MKSNKEIIKEARVTDNSFFEQEEFDISEEHRINKALNILRKEYDAEQPKGQDENKGVKE